MSYRFPESNNIFQTSHSDPVYGLGGYRSFLSSIMFNRLSHTFSNVGNSYNRILELGYGSGVLIPELMSRLDTNGKYVGIDIHQNAKRVYEMAELEKLPREKISLIRGSILDIPLKPDSVDCVVSVSTLEHLPGDILDKSIKEISRVITKDACLVFGFPVKNVALKALAKINKWDFDKEHPSSERDIIDCLKKNNFKIENLQTFPFSLPTSISLYVTVRCKREI